MHLNPPKCREMTANFLHFQPSPINDIQLMGAVSSNTNVSCYKIQDVFVSQDLTWGKHAECVFDKANKRLHALRLLKRAGVSFNYLVKIYCALIRSVLEYASPVWASLASHRVLTKEGTKNNARC